MSLFCSCPKTIIIKIERLVKTVSSSGHLCPASQSKGIIQRFKIRSHNDPVFQLPV